MLSFPEIVRGRRSIRRFKKSAKFNRDSIKRSLKLAILSPNSSNLQTWEFIRISKEEDLNNLTSLCMGQGAARTASELVVFVTRLDKWKENADWNLDQIRKTIKNPQELSKGEKRAIAYYEKLIPLFYGNFPWPLKTWLRHLIVLGRTIVGKPMMRLRSKSDQRIVGHKSTALAAQTFMLSMHNEGMATCPMEGFDSKLVKKYLGLPKATEISMIIACGVADKDVINNPRWRKSYEEVVIDF